MVKLYPGILVKLSKLDHGLRPDYTTKIVVYHTYI